MIDFSGNPFSSLDGLTWPEGWSGDWVTLVFELERLSDTGAPSRTGAPASLVSDDDRCADLPPPIGLTILGHPIMKPAALLGLMLGVSLSGCTSTSSRGMLVAGTTTAANGGEVDPNARPAPSLGAAPAAQAIRVEAQAQAIQTSAAGSRARMPVELGQVSEQVFPSVVLLLAYYPDGTTHYGAAFWIGDGGLALTSRHVIAGARSLGAIPYRKDRVSYTPMDGGLARYVFENQNEVVGATVVEEDKRLDLAMVRIGAERPSAENLEISTEPLKVGDRVFVIGHPQETAWSITTGWINALPNGAIQHDAIVSQGSSGGPVLNDRGQVIGVSIAKVTSEPQGFAFARPITLAGALIATSLQEKGLDLSSPEKTVLSCWHAWEMASPQVVDCFDWDARWSVYVSALEQLSARLSPPLRARFAGLPAAEAKDQWIREQKQQMVLRMHDSDLESPVPMESDRVCMKSPLGLARHKLEEELKTEDNRLTVAWQKQNGFKEDLHDHRAVLQIIRRGIRIEGVKRDNKGAVWVLLAGRNKDATTYRFSEYYVKIGEQWVQRSPPLASDRPSLPKGWPPPIEDPQVLEKRLMLGMIERIERQG